MVTNRFINVLMYSLIRTALPDILRDFNTLYPKGDLLCLEGVKRNIPHVITRKHQRGSSTGYELKIVLVPPCNILIAINSG